MPSPNLEISHATVHRDLKAKGVEIEESQKLYRKGAADEAQSVMRLERVIRREWRIYTKAADRKTQLATLKTISNAIMQKQSVLGDPAQIRKVMNLVSKIRADLTNRDED